MVSLESRFQGSYNTPLEHTPDPNPPKKTMIVESLAYSLLVKVARGVFQRCVETTVEITLPPSSSNNHGSGKSPENERKRSCWRYTHLQRSMIQQIEKICRISKAGAALTVAISMITSARVQFDGFGVRETQFLNQVDLNKKNRDVSSKKVRLFFLNN